MVTASGMLAVLLGAMPATGLPAQDGPRVSASGQEAQRPAAGDIVVEGRRDADRRREAHAFVRAVSGVPVDGQFARWQAPLCPSISGIDDVLAARLLLRLRKTAASVGAPVATPPCHANAIVVFTPNARSLLATMERKNSVLLRDVPLPDRRTLRSAPLPIRWWYGTHSEGADGNQLQSMPSVALGPIGTAGPAIPANDHTRFGDTYRSSMISTGLRVGIEHVVVLIDVPLATGRRLDAVMDYAAFVILGRTRLVSPEGSLPTVLRLFDGDATPGPDALTDQDRAYLTSLYAMPADRPARTQASLLAGGIVRRTTPTDATLSYIGEP